ncbi:FtsX-like permease family protein, partial [Streptococcus sp. HMSC061D10]|uniref:ABC transporter permease n=1 Tax=Streptococcus sp. HMSC061D10 TaxID=1715207 RepID=UPI0028FC0F02
SVSNLIFRMKKNAVGLATITILSTMVLVTMSAATSIYNGSENIKNIMYPHDFDVKAKGNNIEVENLDQLLTQYASEKNLTISNKDVLSYASFGISSQDGTKLTTFEKGENSVMPKTVFLVFDQKDYEKMTGQKLNLTGNEVGLWAKNNQLKGQKSFSLNSQEYSIKQEIQQDFLANHVSNLYILLVSDFNYLVVPDLQSFLDQYQDSAVYPQFYGGMDVTASLEEQLKLADDFDAYVNNFSHNLKSEDAMVYGGNGSSDAIAQMNVLYGGVLFIGIFLSIIFMIGTVLVIYYKQISEGYEDRERFVILQKVGLDQKQIKQTINKQVLTVFFLPVIFAFLHLAFAYHMLSLILKAIGGVDTAMMLSVTLSICGIFALVYVLIFMITSRSYRKIVQI